MEIMEIRNNVIFNGVIPDTSSLLDDIKTSFSCQKKKKTSFWVWFTSRYGRKFCTPFFN
jgi:hypothetical protein